GDVRRQPARGVRRAARPRRHVWRSLARRALAALDPVPLPRPRAADDGGLCPAARTFKLRTELRDVPGRRRAPARAARRLSLQTARARAPFSLVRARRARDLGAPPRLAAVPRGD